MMRNVQLLLIALCAIATLNLTSCRVKGEPLPEPPSSPKQKSEEREIEISLQKGIFDSMNHRIMIPLDSGNVVVVTDLNHSFEDPTNLPHDSTYVWFFTTPREYVQNFDPISSPGEPSLLAINVSSTDKKLESAPGTDKFTPCGTITTVKEHKINSSRYLYHVINDYGNLMLVESKSMRKPWGKIVGDDLAVIRYGSPWKSASTINMNNRMLKYNECATDSWVWVDK